MKWKNPPVDALVTLSELAIARTFGFPDEREVA